VSIPKLELGEPLVLQKGARWSETCRSWNAPDGAEFVRLFSKRRRSTLEKKITKEYNRLRNNFVNKKIFYT